MEDNRELLEKFKDLTSDICESYSFERMFDFVENISKANPNIRDFTDLQKTAFRDSTFWACNKNNIILGTTSSGKTLTAEFNMAYHLYARDEENRQVIYLVPLKALINEKCKEFQQNFPDKRTYSSSSDYQEHDVDLSNGNYDIGVLVYEKFFALLAQKDSKILRNCDLIVVDEMHMLNEKERGPKLEFSIEKARSVNRQLSIIGLSTTESDVSKVKKWLNESKTYIISNEDRPVSIEERFIFCGRFLDERIIKCYENGQLVDPDNSRTDVFQYKNNLDDSKIKSNDSRIYQLIQILNNHPDDKIIVFCNNKRYCEKLMEIICEYIPRITNANFQDFISLEDSDMEEVKYSNLKKYLFDYGVAYHNSNHNIEMREYIEEKFRNGDIRIIVTTETLTMGVNMPTDVMILYDFMVNRNSGSRRMTYHEYKNAIGRAGRFGISKNNKGISYVLSRTIEDFDKSIGDYIKRRLKNKVISGLGMAEKSGEYATEFAPYYLNILNTKNFTVKTVNTLIENGLCRYDNFELEIKENPNIAQEIIDTLTNSSGGNSPEFATFSDTIDDWSFDDDDYVINDLGREMSAFALSMDTYRRIWCCFLKEVDSKTPKKILMHHLPPYTKNTKYKLEPYDLEHKPSSDDIPSYFLNVLYEICCSKEITNKSQYVKPLKDGNDIDFNIKKSISKFLNGKQNFFWESSPIREFCISKENDPINTSDEKTITALYRAIVLYYWVLGVDVTQIRGKYLCLDNDDKYYIYSSEVQSLGEMCAFQLEAIGRAFNCNNPTADRKKLSDMFYQLSIRLKYGMNNELAQIANKHIHGLTRNKLLKLQKEMNRKGSQTLVEFLLYGINSNLSIEQKNALKECFTVPSKYNYEGMVKYLNGQGISLPKFLNYFRDFDDNSMENLRYVMLDIGINIEKIHLENENTIVIKNDTGQPLFKLQKYSENISFSSENYPVIAICKNNKIADIDVHDAFLVSVDDLSMFILNCIRYALKVSKAQEYFIKLLSNIDTYKYDIFDTTKFETIYEEYNSKKKLALANEKVLSHKTTANSQNTIIHNYYINVNINNFNTYVQKLNEMKIAEDDYTILSDEEKDIKEAEFFDKATKEIEPVIESIEPISIEDKTRKIIEDNVNINYTFEEIMKFASKFDGLKNRILEAIYIDDIINKQTSITDYCPAAVMYSRTAEYYLKKMFIPIFIEDIPNYPVKKLKNKVITVINATEQDYTFGSFVTIVNDEYCNFNGRRNHLNPSKIPSNIEKWKEFENLLYQINQLRNQCCHSGTEIDASGMKDLREKTLELISYTDKLIK